MTITKITDHEQQALDRLPSQYFEKLRIVAVQNALSRQIQDLEDAQFDLLRNRALPTAVGVQLTLLGEMLGESRNGRNDDDYRVAIGVRIQRNLSQGEGNRILDIMKALADADDVELFEIFPAHIKVQLNGTIPNDDDIVQALLEIKAAGVGFDLIEYTDRPFAFSRVDESGSDGATDGTGLIFTSASATFLDNGVNTSNVLHLPGVGDLPIQSVDSEVQLTLASVGPISASGLGYDARLNNPAPGAGGYASTGSTVGAGQYSRVVGVG